MSLRGALQGDAAIQVLGFETRKHVDAKKELFFVSWRLGGSILDRHVAGGPAPRDDDQGLEEVLGTPYSLVHRQIAIFVSIVS
jgi:hypothetical protein